jgi:hypothetical protein
VTTKFTVQRPSAFLFQFIRDRAHDLTALPVDPKPPTPFPHADPYLLSSAMQKAIRRGDIVIARRAGQQLHTLDRARLWRRVMVVALEDIGVADITVAAELVGIATLPAARRLLGGDAKALDIALIRACRAVKDRTGDHFGSIIGREPVDEADRTVLGTASSNALLALIASSHLPWTRRLRAAVTASGRADDPARIRAVGTDAVFRVFRELDVPELLLVACAAYAARQRDALPVFVPLAWVLRSSDRAKARVVTHEVPQPELIGKLPAYAFDPVNTRLGRRAVDLFLRAHLMKPPYTPRMVAACLWNAESALCSRTLGWPLGDMIRERAYATDLLVHGLSLDRHAELNAWIARERPALTAARQAVWNSVVRQSGKPVEALEQANLPLPVPTRSRRP